LPSRQQIEQLLEADPDDLFLRYALAKAHVSEGNLEPALVQFRLVLEKNPEYVPAYFQMGQALAEAGRGNEARAIVSRGVVVAQRVGDTHAAAEMTGFLDVL
jgi:Flp pilus assembly protein TadD